MPTDVVLQTFRRLFFYQADHHAEQWRNKAGEVGYSPACDGRFSDECKAHGYRCDTCAHKAPTALTDERIAQHLAGKITLGAYQLREDSTVGWLCIDIDCDEDSTSARFNTKSLALAARGKIEQMGLPVYVEFTGNKGFHLWLFCPDGAQAIVMRRLGLWIMEQALEETGEVHGIHYEVFPKQDSLDARHGYGNLVKVPLGKHKKTNKWCVLLDRDLKRIREQQAYLAEIETVTADDLAAVAEDWIADDWASPDEARRTTNKAERLEGSIANGARNDTLTSLAGTMRRRGMSEDAIFAALLVENQRCVPPLDEDEVQGIAQSVGGYDPAPAPPPDDPPEGWTAYIAHRLQATEHFAKDPGGLIYRYAHGVYIGDGKEFIACESKRILEEAGALAKWTRHRVAEVQAFIGVDAPMLWERLPDDVVNVQNGLFDLNGGELKPHTPEFLSPMQLPAAYDPEAEPTAWIKFCSEVLPDDTQALPWELAAWLMTPNTNIQKAVLLLGAGRNGKSRFLQAMVSFLGKRNVSGVSLHKLEADRFAAARLVGKLANICADLPSAHLAGTSMFKALTGGDMVPTERKYQESFEFQNSARLLFSANHPPTSSDGSKAFFRRWIVVPFEGTFDPGDDGYLPEGVLDAMLAEPKELSGVLNRAIRAWGQVREFGISESASMREAWYEFKEVTDPVEVWLDQNLITTNPEAYVIKSDLLRAYNAAAKADGRPVMTGELLSKAVREWRPGIQDARPRVGEERPTVWKGIGLRAEGGDRGAVVKGGQGGQGEMLSVMGELEDEIRGQEQKRGQDNKIGSHLDHLDHPVPGNGRLCECGKPVSRALEGTGYCADCVPF